LNLLNELNRFLRLDTNIDFQHDDSSNDSGTVTSGGYVDQFNSDYSDELIGRAGMLRLHKMALGEPVAGSMLRAIQNPLKSVNWQLGEIDDITPEEEKVQEFLRWYWFDKYSSFIDLIVEMISVVKYGHCVFERIWEPIKYEGSNKIVPVLERRLQTSIEYIRSRNQTIEFVNASGTLVTIPFEQLVILNIDREGEDLRGKSMLREAYKPYKHKVVYEQLMGIGMQRNATGSPIATVPAGMNIKSKSYIAIKQLLKNWINHEKAYGIIEDNVAIKILENNFDPEKSLKVMQYLDQQMLISILTQFLLLGQGGNGGAYSLGRDQSDTFLDGLIYVVDTICAAFTKQLIQPMVLYNFPNVDASRFRLVGLDLNKRANKEFIGIIKDLITTKAINPTVDDEIFYRKMAKLPNLSEDMIEARRKQEEMILKAIETDEVTVNEDNPPENDNTPVKTVKLSESIDDESKKRMKFLKDNHQAMEFFVKEQLTTIGAKLQADIKSTLDKGSVELKGLNNIELSGISKFEAVVKRKTAGIADVGWSTAKKNAKRNNVKLSAAEEKNLSDITDLELRAFLINQSEEFVEDVVNGLKHQAIYKAQSSVMKGFSVDQTMSRVEEAMDDYINNSPKVTIGSDIIVTNAFNFGQNSFNNFISDELWGFEFVNEDPISVICQWYAGKVFSPGDASLNAATPPLHPRCKSWLNPLYKATNPDRPDITNEIAPPSIQKLAIF